MPDLRLPTQPRNATTRLTRWLVHKAVLMVTSNGSDRPHICRRTDRFIVFASWRQCAPQLIHAWFLEPTWVCLPSGIMIGLTVLQGSSLCLTHRHIDHATTSVAIGRIYVCVQCDIKPFFAFLLSSFHLCTSWRLHRTYQSAVLALLIL